MKMPTSLSSSTPEEIRAYMHTVHNSVIKEEGPVSLSNDAQDPDNTEIFAQLAIETLHRIAKNMETSNVESSRAALSAIDDLQERIEYLENRERGVLQATGSMLTDHVIYSMEETYAKNVLSDVVGCISGREWTEDVCYEVVDILRSAGVPVADEFGDFGSNDPDAE